MEPSRPGLPLTLGGYLPHKKATALLRSADALLVLVGVEPADRHAPSGKLYEAIAAGPPVIAWEMSAASQLTTSDEGEIDIEASVKPPAV